MSNPSRSVIFANGELPEAQIVHSLLTSSDFIVAANGGSRHLHRLGIAPALLIGDSDSLPSDVNAWLERNEVERHNFDVNKDATDLELAIETVAEMGVPQILLLGLAGGRVDHMLANFALLAQAPQRNIAMEAIVGRQRITPVWDRHNIVGAIGHTLSLIPWGGDAHEVWTTGLQWDLHGETLLFAGSRGVSNRITEENVDIWLEGGILLVVHSF